MEITLTDRQYFLKVTKLLHFFIIYSLEITRLLQRNLNNDEKVTKGLQFNDNLLKPGFSSQ